MNKKILSLLLVVGILSFNTSAFATFDNPGTASKDSATGSDFVANGIQFEGATADGIETTITVTDPTSSDKTITIPNASGTVSLTDVAESFSAVKTFTADPLITGTTPLLTIGDAGEEDAQINFDGNVADFSWGLDDSADAVSLSLGTALGTTEVFKADGTTMTVTDALAVDGAFTTTGASTLGNAVTDITTMTGKIAGASPMSFDGNTADTVYTIFAMDDPTSASKTITFPAVTGQVMLGSAATALTPGASVTLTIGDGNQTFTDTITTDNQDQTIDASGAGSAGDRITIIFTTDAAGSGDEVITFGTNFISTGTLTLANAAADIYVVSFLSTGTAWVETARTAIQATA